MDQEEFPCLESAYSYSAPHPLSELTGWLTQMISRVPPEYIDVARCAVLESNEYPMSPTLIIEYERPETDDEMKSRLEAEAIERVRKEAAKHAETLRAAERERATYERLKAKYES